MDFFKSRIWSASDMALIKTGTALFGIAVGLSLPRKCRHLAPLLLLGSAALAARPILRYFQEEPEEDLPWKLNEDRTPAGENL